VIKKEAKERKKAENKGTEEQKRHGNREKA
jgi:hypothetical protein